MRVQSTPGATSQTTFGLASTLEFPIVDGREYTLTFLVAVHTNAYTDMRYMYSITYGNASVPNQNLGYLSISKRPAYATMQNQFNLMVTEYKLTFVSKYTDTRGRLLIGSKVAKDLSGGSYGLVYVSDIKLVETPVIETLKLDWMPTDYYNYQDLNRVESATLVVRDKIVLFRGEIVPLDEVFSARTQETIEYADSLNRIETNLERMKLTFPNPSMFDISKTDWTQDKPFDFSDATRYERMLHEMYYTIENNISNIPYCGQLVAGQEGVI